MRWASAGLTLRQIAEILEVRDGGRVPCGHVARVDDRLADVEERLAELRETRTQLRELRVRLAELVPADRPPDNICIAVSRPCPQGPRRPSQTLMPIRREPATGRDGICLRVTRLS
jgi:hypothetical protein